MTFGSAEDFAQQVQDKLLQIERRHKRTGESIAELHTMLADGLEQFGPGAGCDGEVIAAIVTPKRPN